MIVAAIVAMDRNGVIGVGGKLPWHLPEDLRSFRRKTMDDTVIMGRKTWESLPGPLEGRANIVVTRTGIDAVGVQVCGSIEEAISEARPAYHGDRVWIIGGGEVFAASVDLWDELHLTVVDGDFEDSNDDNTYFPIAAACALDWEADDFHRLVIFADENNSHRFHQVRLSRVHARFSLRAFLHAH